MRITRTKQKIPIRRIEKVVVIAILQGADQELLLAPLYSQSFKSFETLLADYRSDYTANTTHSIDLPVVRTF
jgi:hypothetical protein